MLLEKVPTRKSNVEPTDPMVTRGEFEDMYPDGFYDKPYFQESKELLCFDKGLYVFKQKLLIYLL